MKEINENLSIVVISAYSDQQEIKDLYTQGCVVLTKPFDLEELRRVVANLLNSKS